MFRFACLTPYKAYFMALALMMGIMPVACIPHGTLSFAWFYLPFDPIDVDGDGDLDILDDSGFGWYRMDQHPEVYRPVELLWWRDYSTHATLAPSAEYPGGMALFEKASTSSPSLDWRLVASGQLRDFTAQPFVGWVEQIVLARSPSLHLVALGAYDSDLESTGALALAYFSLDPGFNWNQLRWQPVLPPSEFPDLYDRMLKDNSYRRRAYAHVRDLPHARFCYFAYMESPHLRSAVVDVVDGQAQLRWMEFPEVSDPSWVVGSSNPIPCRDVQGMVREDCMIIPRPTIDEEQGKNGPTLFDRFEVAPDGVWRTNGPSLSIPHEYWSYSYSYVRLRSGQGYELVMTPWGPDKELRARVIDLRAPALAISAELVIPLVRSIFDWYWYDLNGDGLDDGVASPDEGGKLYALYLNRGDGTFEVLPDGFAK